MKKALVSFIPVLHKGYLDLLTKHPDDVYILGPEITADYTSLTRDLRVIESNLVKHVLDVLGIAKKITVADKKTLENIDADEIVMPDEEVSRDLAEKYFKNKKVTYESVFLRWHKAITVAETIVPPDRIISTSDLDREFMKYVTKEAEKSADWWRWNGAVAVKDDVILAMNYNKTLPSHFSHATFGDMRSNFDAGQHIDLVSTIHAEARLVAHAAKEGLALAGASAYVTTFPCPPCAKLLLEAGIKKIYYQKGYSMIDAEKLLKDAGVEIILVQ